MSDERIPSEVLSNIIAYASLHPESMSRVSKDFQQGSLLIDDDLRTGYLDRNYLGWKSLVYEQYPEWEPESYIDMLQYILNLTALRGDWDIYMYLFGRVFESSRSVIYLALGLRIAHTCDNEDVAERIWKNGSDIITHTVLESCRLLELTVLLYYMFKYSHEYKVDAMNMYIYTISGMRTESLIYSIIGYVHPNMVSYVEDNDLWDLLLTEMKYLFLGTNRIFTHVPPLLGSILYLIDPYSNVTYEEMLLMSYVNSSRRSIYSRTYVHTEVRNLIDPLNRSYHWIWNHSMIKIAQDNKLFRTSQGFDPILIDMKAVFHEGDAQSILHTYLDHEDMRVDPSIVGSARYLSYDLVPHSLQ